MSRAFLITDPQIIEIRGEILSIIFYAEHEEVTRLALVAEVGGNKTGMSFLRTYEIRKVVFVLDNPTGM